MRTSSANSSERGPARRAAGGPELSLSRVATTAGKPVLHQCSIDFFTVDARDGAALARVVAAEAVLVRAVLVMAMRAAPDTAIPNARAVVPRPAPWLGC